MTFINGVSMHKVNLVMIMTMSLSIISISAQIEPEYIDNNYKIFENKKLEISSKDGNYRLGVSGLLQENNRFNYYKNGNKKSVNIELNRAHISVHGSIIDHRLTFLAKTSLQKKIDVTRELNLLTFSNYYVNIDVDDRYFQLRIGKFQLPFSRQLMTSSSQTKFYDLDNASKKFAFADGGNDVGIMIHNSIINPFEWAFAVAKHGLVARIAFNQHNIDGYDQVDWTGGDIRFGFGANGYLKTDYITAKINDIRGGADFIVKVGGFSTNGLFLYQMEKNNDKVTHNFGGGTDLGYLIQEYVEPVGRFSWHRQGDGPHNFELLGGINYYIHKHNFKIQAYGGVDLIDKEISQGLGGVQFQLAI